MYGSQYTYHVSNYTPTRFGSAYNSGLPVLPAVDYTYWRTKAIAGLNPNRPIVDLPVFIYELRDFPGMLRDLGRVLQKKIRASDVPGGYLAYTFGWAPLIQDLLKLDRLAIGIGKRLKELNSARKGESFRRTLSRRKERYQGPFVTDVSPTMNSLTVSYESWIEEHIWFTAYLRLTPEAQSDLASLLTEPGPSRAAFLTGFSTMGAATLWNAYPWTWLVDYLGNVGDVLEAGRGFIPFQVKDMCIMAHQTLTETSTVSTNKTGLEYTPHLYKYESKGRRAYETALPGLALRPFLTEGQEGILTALVLANALRGIGS